MDSQGPRDRYHLDICGQPGSHQKVPLSSCNSRQHLTIRIIDNLNDILQVRPDVKINIQWVPGHAGVAGNETADGCAAGLPGRCSDPPTSLAYIKRQIQEVSLREWQQIETTTVKGHGCCNITQRQRDWGPSWKPTKLITNTNQTTVSTINQLRPGRGCLGSFLIRLPSYDSTQCQCSERVQSAKHLPLGCRLYQDERQQAGITTPPFYSKGSNNVAGLHPDDRGSNTSGYYNGQVGMG